MDERQWLLATAYNTGTECLQCAHLANHNLSNLLMLPSFVWLFFSCYLVHQCWMKQNDGLKHRLLSAGLYLVGTSALRRCVRSTCAYHQWLSIGAYIGNFQLMERESIHLRLQKRMPIFFHAMGQNDEAPENMGPSTGYLDSDVSLCDMGYPRLRRLQSHLNLFISVHLSASCVSFPLAPPDSNCN